MKHLPFVAARRYRAPNVRRCGPVARTLALAGVLGMSLPGVRAESQAPVKPTAESETPAKPTAESQAPAKPAAAPTLTIEVTDSNGDPLGDVSVVVAGPVDRSGMTNEKGSVMFRSMRAGTYRLRFEHEGFVGFEREVVISARKPASISVSLTPAAEPPPPPDPPPSPQPPPSAAPALREVDPRTLSILEFLDKEMIGREPQRTTLLGCANGGTARLLQIRDPLENQQHAGLDEILYIVAGAGMLRIGGRDTKVEPGFFALVPRGVSHSIRREGRRPLIALSVLAGAPCEDLDVLSPSASAGLVR